MNIDDRGGARAVAQHLVDLGHRRFGLVLPYEDGATDAATATEVSDPTRTEDRTRWRCFIRYERLLGWRDPIVAAGIDWAHRAGRQLARRATMETGYRAAAPLLDRADRPTAIICLSDVLALGVLRAAAERGIRVPQDLSVVGYDDIAAAAHRRRSPPCYQPHAAKGEEAVRLLTTGGDDVVLPTNLVVRASQRTRPELNTPERSPDHARSRRHRTHRTRPQPRGSSPHARAVRARRSARRRRAPRSRAPQRRARPAHARRSPRARRALRPAVLSAPSAM